MWGPCDGGGMGNTVIARVGVLPVLSYISKGFQE